MVEDSIRVHAPSVWRVHTRLDDTSAGETLCGPYLDSPVRLGHTRRAPLRVRYDSRQPGVFPYLVL